MLPGRRCSIRGSLSDGRDLVDRVLATVPNNSLLLLGERRIGKTSMLHQLSLQLPKLDHPRFCFVPVPIDLQGVAEEAFFATVAEAVGETIGDETHVGRPRRRRLRLT